MRLVPERPPREKKPKDRAPLQPRWFTSHTQHFVAGCPSATYFTLVSHGSLIFNGGNYSTGRLQSVANVNHRGIIIIPNNSLAGRQAGRTGIPGLQMKRQLSMAKVTHPVSQLPAGRNRLGLRSAHSTFSAVFPTVHPRGDKVGTCNWRGFWLTV